MLVVLCLLMVAACFWSRNASAPGIQAGFFLFAVFCMIWFAISIWVPMHVYEVSIWRALAFSRSSSWPSDFCFTLANIQLQ